MWAYSPLPGAEVDNELGAVQQSTTTLRDAIMDARRSGGALRNGVVTQEGLAPTLVAELTVTTASLVAEAEEAESAAIGAADEAIQARDEGVAVAASIEAIAQVLAARRTFSDYGSIADPPGEARDYGSIV